MVDKKKINVFWFRRDLRLQDNVGLDLALNSGHPVLCVFIFDQNIIDELDRDDSRLSFIHEQLTLINENLQKYHSGLHCVFGTPSEEWAKLNELYDIQELYYNKDYEPYALTRDEEVEKLFSRHNAKVIASKDQVIFEQSEIVKADGLPYTVFTPYKNKWLATFDAEKYASVKIDKFQNLLEIDLKMISLTDLGFTKSKIKVKEFTLASIGNYAESRNFPGQDTTSYLSPHLRFGTISPRQIISLLKPSDDVFLSELIWREFFMQIIYHFPESAHRNFRPKYDLIVWRNNEDEFKLWSEGMTGYPLVDAGMRELNATGYMHNRVRMVVASFLCKHLLIDWKWGEAYFAKKLLDFELSSNVGNWQWAAGTGCDAAPYFRIFNPIEQFKKFDKDFKYVRKWVPEFEGFGYPEPMVDHKIARLRALETYKIGIAKF
ncbi:MAG: deoxyribodipyrimidine photo-lyase [Patiriisocius sp.]|jgi:deoxyribodipyrimidine photo-lyase